MSRNINISKNTRLSTLPVDDDSWTTIHDTYDNPIMGMLCCGRIYKYIPVSEFSVRYSNTNLWSTPVIECKGAFFKFQSDVKCVICKRGMKIALKFIDHYMSYCIDTEKHNQKVIFARINKDLYIGHRHCMKNVMMCDDDFIFIIQKLKMSLLEWWKILILKTPLTFISMCIIIIFMGYLMIHLVSYMTVNEPKNFGIYLIILLTTLFICRVILMVMLEHVKRSADSNGCGGSRRALRLGLRERLDS